VERQRRANAIARVGLSGVSGAKQRTCCTGPQIVPFGFLYALRRRPPKADEDCAKPH